MSSARPISASEAAALALALGMGVAVLGFRLSWQGYWWDEYVTLMFTRAGWHELMVTYWGLDTHRPVYYGLQKLWVGLFGESVVAVRSLPVVLMLPVIPLFFFIARRVGPAPMAPVTALLMASAPMFLYMGREVRMYSLATLALAVVLLLFVILAERAREEMRRGLPAQPGTTVLWVGVALAMALAFYVQALAAFVALLFGLWVLICTVLGYLPRRFLWQSLGAAALFVILILPALQPFLAHASGTLGQSFWLPEPSFGYIYKQTATAYAYPKLMKPVVGLLLLWGLWSLRGKPHIAWLFGLMVFGLPALVLAVSFWKPIYMAKVIAWGSIVSIPLLAAGLAPLRPVLRWSGVLALVAAQLVAAWRYYPSEPERADEATMAAALAAEFDPEHDVLVLGDQMHEPALRWYAPEIFETGRVHGFTYGDWTKNVIDPALRSEHVMRNEAARVPRPEGRLWILREPGRKTPVSPGNGVDEAIGIVTRDLALDRSIASGPFRLDIFKPR